MVTWYWAAEYIKVLAGYVFLMFIWPCFMLRKYLKGRSTTFLFSFCVVFQPVLINTVVILLGLFHILNAWVIRGLFYIPFFVEALRWLAWGKKETRNLKHLLNRTYGLKMLCHNVICGMGRRIGSLFRLMQRRLHRHLWEYGLLSALIIYGMIYFSWGVFQTYCYGAGDIYVHNSWIYGLVQGNIFSAGVYPEGMHCFIYGLHTLFGVRIYSCMLFLEPVHVAVILLSMYVFLKEVFHWKYTPMFVLAAFLTLDVVNMDAIFSMARLQWTLPQEFGTHTVFLCAAFLVRYLRSTHRRAFRGKQTKGYWDENLLVFSLSLAASLIIHFYPTIMAFFLCAAFVPLHIKKIFSRKRFLPLVTAVMVGVIVAVTPMAAAFATGIPLEGSMYWAMAVMGGNKQKDPPPKESQGANPENQTSQGSAEQGSTEQGSVSQGNAGQGGTEPGSPGQSGSVSQNVFPAGIENSMEGPPKEPLTKRLTAMARRVEEMLKEKWQTLYYRGYERLFGEQRAKLAIGASLFALLFWVCYRFLVFLLRLVFRRKKEKFRPEYFDLYFSVTAASFFYMVMTYSARLGLPTLVEAVRLYALDQFLMLAVVGVVFDLVFTVLGLKIWESVLKAASAAVVAGIFAVVIITGNYHGFLFVHLTRLNSAVLVTYSITKTMPPYSFTIVSPTDELYQQIQYGWHEELSGFVNQVQEKEYTLPTEHIFIFIEKEPFMYAQYHLASGPRWLASEKYLENFGGSGSSYASQSPDMIDSEIDQELDLTGVKYVFDLKSSTYAVLNVRTLVESLAYKWCQEFEARYPGELQTYYEDERFVCYYIRQNPQSLYQLGLLYQEEEE